MNTATLNISLSEELKAFVDARTQARGYSSASEYVHELLHRDEEQAREERAKEERFRTLIQEGLDSGPGRPWTQVKAELLARTQAHRNGSRPDIDRT